MADISSEFAANRQSRCPLVLVLDVSGSMEVNNHIGQLNDGLKLLQKELSEDNLASLRVQIALITFDSQARVVQPFIDALNFQPPTLVTSGATAMGEAMDLALKTIEEQKRAIRAQNLSYYRPWIWLMSDGEPTDPGWEAAAERCLKAADNKKAVVYAIAIGEAANLATLQKFTKNAPLRIKPGQFGAMFEWLSMSVSAVATQSVPIGPKDGEGGTTTTASGEQITFTSPTGWGASQ